MIHGKLHNPYTTRRYNPLIGLESAEDGPNKKKTQIPQHCGFTNVEIEAITFANASLVFPHTNPINALVFSQIGILLIFLIDS